MVVYWTEKKKDMGFQDLIAKYLYKGITQKQVENMSFFRFKYYNVTERR
jgi:hypothetical protein